MSNSNRDKNGRFKKGCRASPATEFKKGQHWRSKKPYWDHGWLYNEYIVKRRSASEIATDFGCHENNILYFLKKHSIEIRTISEIRAFKFWGLPGKQNGMYGRRGSDHPNWQGGCTPDRQAFYSSRRWKRVCALVWKRDKATCQRCGKRSVKRGGKRFHIHHIISFAVKESRADLDNLVLLCRKCHRWVHSKKNAGKEFIGDS